MVLDNLLQEGQDMVELVELIEKEVVYLFLDELFTYRSSEQVPIDQLPPVELAKIEEVNLVIGDPMPAQRIFYLP